ncbi:hypothetical protein ACQEWB_49775 [Streptomyces sp. CA-249302]|uniref:hypothetical protein n=1 Tax=Streptomyces sp. CA-249302 TaxID=3240058 RepID=UPI003D8EDC6E
MTLVRRSMLHNSEHGHLAEVALGGLFEPWDASTTDLAFDFRPGVRDALLGSQRRSDVSAVRELVRQTVWQYLEQRHGAVREFLATRVDQGTSGQLLVDEHTEAFAELRRAPDDEPRPDAHPNVTAESPTGQDPDRNRIEAPSTWETLDNDSPQHMLRNPSEHPGPLGKEEDSRQEERTPPRTRDLSPLGRTGRAAVVFVHGLFSSSDTWRELGAELSRMPGVAQDFDFLFFDYATPRTSFSPLRKMPNLDTVADVLRDYLDSQPSTHERLGVRHP